MQGRDVIDALGSSMDGLTAGEAKSRLRTYGRNELQARMQAPVWFLFLRQFRELLVIILVLGGLTSLLIGDYRGGTIIFLIVLVNAVIGFTQEYRAGKIVDALKVMLRSGVKVRRDGELVEINPELLVPGDIIVIDEGDTLPADVRLLKSSSFKTNDFALTGESVPREKTTDPVAEDAGLADRTNMAYAGTSVAAGNAVGIVVATGMSSETGRIAGMTQETGASVTPLQEEMRDLARKLTVVVVIISILLFAFGLLQDFSIYVSLAYALGVAMAVVPQALPAQVTVALATGSGRLAKRKAVVKSLPSVETLGSTTVICTDKTGTLTRNEMTVRAVWFDGADHQVTGSGYEPAGEILDESGERLGQEAIDEMEILLDAATMASNAEIHEPDEDHADWYGVGDPTEAALIALSTKLGTRSPKEDEENPELQEFPFDSERKRMSSVRRFGDKVALAVKGSLDGILSISTHIYRDGEAVPITAEDEQRLREINERYSENGMRVLAVGRRDLDAKTGDFAIEEAERDITLLGLVAMIDPPKEGVPEAIGEALKAGIRIFILTGDHAITARAIANEVGLVGHDELQDVGGVELKEMDDDALKRILSENASIIFSRVDPEDKLRIVSLLVDSGEIVAVTGDGVNDAPALRKAHIGVAMGKTGTDVAKEASTLILLDDSFSTLVEAIREGRTIYGNLRKTVFSTLTTNTAELTLVVCGLVAVALGNLPIPILAVQILAIDLLGQIMPLTFLTFDPPERGVMRRRPRDPASRMLNAASGIEVMSLGALIGGLAFANFLLFMQREGIRLTMGDTGAAYLRVTALTYATIVFCQYVNTMERRHHLASLFSRTFFTNRILLGSILASIGIVIVAMYGPFVRDFLRFGGLRFSDWVSVGISCVVFACAWEVLKLVRRLRGSGDESEGSGGAGAAVRTSGN
ncbi:MAG: cation-transporting P-type ATPase [Candidatus Krumholzibacteriota bacterium]|nr:cation-transporting P-type ATPase [Candidatus Krumholzibacteriota bacterium]